MGKKSKNENKTKQNIKIKIKMGKWRKTKMKNGKMKKLQKLIISSFMEKCSLGLLGHHQIEDHQ